MHREIRLLLFAVSGELSAEGSEVTQHRVQPSSPWGTASTGVGLRAPLVAEDAVGIMHRLHYQSIFLL